MVKTPERKNWLVYMFRTELRRMVEEEGKKHGRTAPKQLEVILAERYNMPMLTDEDKSEAKRQIRQGEDRAVVERPRKGGRKDAAA